MKKYLNKKIIRYMDSNSLSAESSSTNFCLALVLAKASE